MKLNYSIAALLLMVAGWQTAMAQGMRVVTNGNKNVIYDLNDVKKVVFFEGSPENAYESVDLGLPSGTLWATCNLGADSPEEVGCYYAWGETETKEDYSNETYAFYVSTAGYSMYHGPATAPTGYQSDYRFRLLPQHDAATASWGEGWNMPSNEQFQELINSNNTTVEQSELNGQAGFKITSKVNGKSIFLPATGLMMGTTLRTPSMTRYWSRSLNATNNKNAYCLYGNTSLRTMGQDRNMGMCIRPVKTKKTVAVPEYVDLGLPNGTLWASCNLGAINPEDIGTPYAWGETETKEIGMYTQPLYKFFNPSTGYFLKYNTSDGMNFLEAADDAATVNMGAGWSIPTPADFLTLLNDTYTKRSIEKVDDVYGLRITSKINGNSIFLPSTCVYDQGRVWDLFLGSYFSNMIDRERVPTCEEVKSLTINVRNGSASIEYTIPRYVGAIIRPVKK